MSTTQSGTLTTARPSVIQLAIKEKAALYAAYIPAFSEGGIFVPSAREHRLGDDVYVLLTLLDDPQRYPVSGKVAWITPARAAGNRTQQEAGRHDAHVDDRLMLQTEAVAQLDPEVHADRDRELPVGDERDADGGAAEDD